MEKPLAKQESAKALQSYKEEQAKFKNTPTQVDVSKSGDAVRNIRTSTTYSPGSTYHERRTVFYGGYSPPVYVYSFAPRYGVWDAMFMMWLLDNNHHHETFYHQSNDPGFKAWRREAEKQAENNTELREKLARMDERVKQMEKQGVQRDPSFVPEEAKSVALAEEVAAKEIKTEHEGGFPWGWTFIILCICAGAYLYIKRRNA
jgi:hypothetical protein